jgi:hypothetical protein
VAKVLESLGRVPRDAIPPTPPGPEGSNGNGLVRVQRGARSLFLVRYAHRPLDIPEQPEIPRLLLQRARRVDGLALSSGRFATNRLRAFHHSTANVLLLQRARRVDGLALSSGRFATNRLRASIHIVLPMLLLQRARRVDGLALVVTLC